jgi:surface protein
MKKRSGSDGAEFGDSEVGLLRLEGTTGDHLAHHLLPRRARDEAAAGAGEPLENLETLPLELVLSLLLEARSALAEATYGHISTWNVSGVADMSYLFCAASGSYSASNGCNSACSTFNGNVSAWDVSSVTCMEYMFYLASSFNQPLANWDVSSVTSMRYMFCSASSFNQPLANWVVSSVTSMRYMFWSASSFNHPLASWGVARVTSMEGMFLSATSFNQALEDWDVSSVTCMEYTAIRDRKIFSSGLLPEVVTISARGDANAECAPPHGTHGPTPRHPHAQSAFRS